jgi:hypothetical protein
LTHELMGESVDGLIIFWHYWEMVKTRRWASVGVSRSMGVIFEGSSLSSAPSVLSLSLLPKHHEVSASLQHMFLLRAAVPHHRPTAMEPASGELKPPKP